MLMSTFGGLRAVPALRVPPGHPFNLSDHFAIAASQISFTHKFPGELLLSCAS